MWHASIALVEGQAAVRTADIDRKGRRMAADLARDLLRGVGVEPSREEAKGLAFHLRRALSSTEIARLDPEWLALPAIDLGG